MNKSNNNQTVSKKNSFVYMAAAISALGGMLFGYDTGVISSAILFIKKEFSLSSIREEIVVSFVLVGAVIGAAAAGKLADRMGRRKIIILTAIIFVLAALGTSISPTVNWLIFGRLIVGVAIGAASFITPLYISEISPINIRGKLVSFNQLAVTIGIVLSYLVGYALSVNGDWRLMFALASIPAAILGIGLLFMPDSPRWLCSRNRSSEAKVVLQNMRGESDVGSELKGIQKSLEKQSGDWKQLFSPHIRPALIIGIGLAIFQQVTGINTVIYYAPTIFQFAGFQSASAAILATISVGVVNVIMTIIALLLLDKVGRRPLLLTGMAGMVVSLSVLGFTFHSQNVLGWVAVLSLVVYVGSFAISLGPVFWLLISEIYPLRIRGLAMSVATVVNWGVNLIVALTFLTMIQLLGKPATFWVYALFGFVSWLFSYFLVPETKERSLEEIEAHWRERKHPLAMGNDNNKKER